jgi:hypothetical protein
MALGPSVLVTFLADTKALGNAVKAVGEQGATVASSMGTAFHGMLGTLNQTGVLGPFGTALSGVDQALQAINDHGKTVGTTMMGVGGAVAGIGVGLSVLASSDKAAQQQLQQAITATGHDYEDYASQVEGAIKRQEHYGNSAKDTQDALRILTQATNDPQKAIEDLGIASNLAAAKHESLDAASTQLAKTINGSTRLLKEYGLSATDSAKAAAQLAEDQTAAEKAADAAAKAHQHLADVQAELKGKTTLTAAEHIKLRDATQAVEAADKTATAAHDKLTAAQKAAAAAGTTHLNVIDQLGSKLSGQASAQANTFNGHLKAMKAAIEDAAASFGQKYGPALTVAGTALTALGGLTTVVTGIKNALTASTEAATAATEAETAATDAAAVSEGLALGPILLIIAAVALLVVGIYELATHWTTVWNAIKDAAKAVWDWIAANWPLLVGILLGPIALAVVEIVKHWGEIKDGLADAWNFIVGKWSDLYGFISGIVGAIGRVLAGLWKAAEDASNAIHDFIIGKWNDLIGFLGSIPRRIGGALSGMWDFVTDTFRAAINGVIHLWNALSFTTPHISIFGHDTPSVTVGVPQIPYLAQGGLMTADGLVYAHAGEVISPAPAGAGGPLVNIENVNLSDSADVDLLLSKLHFATTAGRL